MLRRILLLIVLGLLVGAAPATYNVQLHRPLKAGDQRTFEISTREEFERWSSQPHTSVKTFVEVKAEGDSKILEVTNLGKEKRQTMTFRKLEWRTAPDGAWKKSSSLGKAITIVQYPSLSFERSDGKDLSDGEKTALAALLSKTDDHTTQELYGTEQPVKVDELWQVNAPTLEQMLEFEGVKGTGKIKSVTQVRGQPCVVVNVEGSASRPNQSGMYAQTGHVRFAFEATLPVDPKLGQVSETSEFEIKIDGDQGPGPKDHLTLLMRKSESVKWTPKTPKK